MIKICKHSSLEASRGVPRVCSRQMEPLPPAGQHPCAAWWLGRLGTTGVKVRKVPARDRSRGKRMVGGSGQVPPTEVRALQDDQVAKKQQWRSLNLLLGSHLCLPITHTLASKGHKIHFKASNSLCKMRKGRKATPWSRLPLQPWACTGPQDLMGFWGRGWERGDKAW